MTKYTKCYKFFKSNKTYLEIFRVHRLFLEVYLSIILKTNFIKKNIWLLFKTFQEQHLFLTLQIKNFTSIKPVLLKPNPQITKQKRYENSL